jgi:hypothetical protein
MNNNFIGSTHIDNIKLTSNILEQHIYITNINNSNYTRNVSNILNTNSSNYTSNASIILNTNSSNYTNILRHDVNKWINEQLEPSLIPSVNLTHTYIYNSNLLGEIRFVTKGMPSYITNENKNYIIRIKENGAFELYYQYSFIYPTVLGGWYNIMNSIRDAYAYQATNAGIVGEIQIAINRVNSQLIAIESGLGALATNVELLNGMTVEEIDGLISDTYAMNLGNIFNNASILGISSLGFLAIITGTLANILYDQFLTAQLKELAKMTNPNITEAQKAAYMEQIKQKAIDNLNEFNVHLRSLNDTNGCVNSNITSQQYINSLNTIDFRINNINISNIYVSSNVLSNLNINHGFINSNITTEQYISSLKCNTLNLNTGNIENINGITANEIIANGKIKQNNILLDNIYLTSNHLYIIICYRL